MEAHPPWRVCTPGAEARLHRRGAGVGGPPRPVCDPPGPVCHYFYDAWSYFHCLALKSACRIESCRYYCTFYVRDHWWMQSHGLCWKVVRICGERRHSSILDGSSQSLKAKPIIVDWTLDYFGCVTHSENRKEYWWRVWWCGWKPSQMPHWQSRHCWTRCSSCCSQWALREEVTMSKERNAHQLCLAQGHYALRRGQFHLWFTLKNIFQFSTRLDYSATFLGINVSSKQNRKEV